MLSSQQLQIVNSLTRTLNSQQLSWLSGYLSGLQIGNPLLAADTSAPEITVLYGSHSGNGKGIADALVATLAAVGKSAKGISMTDYKTAQLKKQRYLLVVISTHGEGEPPDSARSFYDFIHSARAPKLNGLQYAVLALGDSSYAYFCQTGRDIDERLTALGAKAIIERVECDVDFEHAADKWRQKVEDVFGKQSGSSVLPVSSAIVMPTVAMHGRANPFMAPLLESIILTAAPRHTLHLELSLEESGLVYYPGDSLGVFPQNNLLLAHEVAELLGLSWDASLRLDDETASVEEWLLNRLDIAQPTPPVLARYADMMGNASLQKLAADREAAGRYLLGRSFANVLKETLPSTANKGEILSCLRRLTPRLYSLASSPVVRTDEAHLLIGQNTFIDFDGEMRSGVCSDYLHRLAVGGGVRVFVQSNDNFRLPVDSQTPIIMIGAGTGIAPYRAFMEEREATGGGDSWLIFGERNRRDDFYYQREWQSYLRSGVLSRLDAAFSRDQNNKVYVQDKLRVNGGEVWRWLEAGAVLYVCGDERRMAKEVHTAIKDIIYEHGNTDGSDYLQQLQANKRYQRDVY